MQKAGFSIIQVLWSLVMVSLACSSPVSDLASGSEEEIAESESWQFEVDAIKTMTNLPIPNFLIDPEASPSGEVFDPNQLLIPLDHLSLHPDQTLDFVYKYDGMGGKPILYARKHANTPLDDYAAYTETYDTEKSYLDSIECDGTEESYFQWVLLEMMGDQFYLYWHSGYHDAEIIASRDRLEGLVAEMASTEFGVNFTSSQKRQALKINPAPVVKLGEETVSVQVVWFTRWGGFNESVYTLSRSYPHQVLALDARNLLEYDCGVLY